MARPDITTLPNVLAGPILRRVEPHGVTVWLALKVGGSVGLSVTAASGGPALMRGSRRAVQLARNLFVVAVTASPTGANLTPGTLYRYDVMLPNGLGFQGSGNISAPGQTFNPATLGYQSHGLPTFALPPADLNHLRIFHTSCRKPHGSSYDALSGLDEIISFDADDALARPHYLFLTGDQIYADDVADVLLYMIRELRGLLGVADERLPAPDGSSFIPPEAPLLWSGHRHDLVVPAGLTSGVNSSKSHLLTFHEYALMYLLVWSNVLWWTGELPDDPPNMTSERFREGFAAERHQLVDFRATLPQVRRALANVPTYMMFDDHDVTDDWNINSRWCSQVYQTRLGRRIVTNALLAYALFQGWGNKPGDFAEPASGASRLPGAELLFRTEAMCQALINNNQEAADSHRNMTTERLPLPQRDHVLLHHRLNREARPAGAAPTWHPSQMYWHYTVRGPGYEVLVLDTRTWRGYPHGDMGPPTIITNEGLDTQVWSEPHDASSQVTFVVLPPPWLGLREFESLQRLAVNADNLRRVEGAFEWDFEAPGAEPLGFEALLGVLAARFPIPAGGRRRSGRVIFLSGDLHFAFAQRMRYEAEIAYRHGSSGPAEMVVVQLVASASKNESSSLINHLHNDSGPLWGRNLTLRLVWRNDGRPRNDPGAHVQVGLFGHFSSVTVNPSAEFDYFERLYYVGPFQARGGRPPDWWYRIDQLAADPPPTQVRRPSPPPQPVNDPTRITTWRDMAMNHANWATILHPGYAVIARNNLGEMRFMDWPAAGGAGRRKLVHRLWWRLGDSGALLRDGMRPFSRWTISMEVNDPAFPRLMV